MAVHRIRFSTALFSFCTFFLYYEILNGSLHSLRYSNHTLQGMPMTKHEILFAVYRAKGIRVFTDKNLLARSLRTNPDFFHKVQNTVIMCVRTVFTLNHSCTETFI